MAFFMPSVLPLCMLAARILYHILLRCYYSLLGLVGLFHPKARAFMEGRKQSRTLWKNWSPQGSKVVWFHCASLGEFEQGRPLMEAFKARYPDWKLVLSFYSPSGYEVRKNYGYADLVVYMPLDYPGHAKAFIHAIQPSLAVFVKYEYWLFHLRALKKRGVSVALVAGIFRPNQLFFQWYGFLHRRMLHYFRHFFVQNEESKSLLSGLGFSRVSVSGDPRFDRVADVHASRKPIAELEAFCKGEKVWVLGSVWPKDLTLFSSLIRSGNEKWVVVPHELHPSFMQEWEQLAPGRSVRFSAGAAAIASSDARLLVVDQVGLLSSIYAYASQAYVGGGLGKGLHNTLEAAVYGIPVFFGALNYRQFDEVKQMEALGCAFGVSSERDLRKGMRYLREADHYQKAAAKAAQFVEKHRGATASIMESISTWT